MPVYFREPDRPRYQISFWLILFVVVLLLLLAPYIAQQVAFSIARGRELARAEVAQKVLQGLPPAANRYASVAKIVEPSVVGIQTTVQVASPFGDGDLFGPEIRATAQGSGVIVDAAGYILTNAHVVSQAAEGGLTVQLSDGRSIQHVVLVGLDPATDLAVLKIDAGKLSAARWGDSNALQVGDPVLAVGSPYGLTETVTAGIISAKNRKVGIENVQYEDFLQTDAAINPGNSGGPLVNMDAQLVGINTAIVGHAYQGIGFAIPSAIARRVYDLLRTSGISRGWIGVGVQDLTKSLADKFKLKETRGALVAQIVSGSPAEEAGLRPGDVIVAWKKQPITNSIDLRIAVARTQPGDRANVVVYRNGKRTELTVATAERPNKLAQ
jgi:serine protease Do